MFTMADLKEYVQFNRDFIAVVREAKKAGKTAEEAISYLINARSNRRIAITNAAPPTSSR